MSEKEEASTIDIVSFFLLIILIGATVVIARMSDYRMQKQIDDLKQRIERLEKKTP